MSETLLSLISSLSALLLLIRRNSLTEISLEHPGFEVDASPPDTERLIPLPEIHPLSELPRLDANEKEDGRDEDDAPLPADSLMLEYLVIDDGNVEHREDGDEAGADGEEEELVAPDIDEPLCKVLLGTGLHAEEGTAHINHLPSEKEREPGEACEASRASAEDGIASI